MDFIIGNTKGQYFTQSRFESLKELAQELQQMNVPMEDVTLHYGPNQDYHHLTFRSGFNVVDVRYYKVLAYKINDVEHWSGCPINGSFNFARNIKLELSKLPDTHNPYSDLPHNYLCCEGLKEIGSVIQVPYPSLDAWLYRVVFALIGQKMMTEQEFWAVP